VVKLTAEPSANHDPIDAKILKFYEIYRVEHGIRVQLAIDKISCFDKSPRQMLSLLSKLPSGLDFEQDERIRRRVRVRAHIEKFLQILEGEVGQCGNHNLNIEWN
jgi:hypothetical protein